MRAVGRVADGDLRQLGRHRLHHGVDVLGGHEGPPDRRALLARLDRHLGDELADVEVELGGARARRRGRAREVERVGLGGEPHAVADDAGVRAQRGRGGRRAGEPDEVLAGEVVERVAERARDELHGTRRQQLRLDDQAHQLGGEERRGAGGLDQRGHARQERGRELLQRAPHREVERVDLHRHAVQRGRDVLAEERAALAERLDVALDVHLGVRQLPTALRRVRQQYADAAVDVEARVVERGAGVRGDGVQLLAVLPQVPGERLEQGGALVERQLAERRAADPTAVLQRGREVDARRRQPGDLGSGHRVEQRSPLVGRRVPRAEDVTAQDRCHTEPPRSTDRSFG